MARFLSFHGVVTMISNFEITSTGEGSGCYKLMSVQNETGELVNFVIEPTTYFVDHVMISIGDRVTGFYDANAPVPLIYPPQYRAVVIVRDSSYENVKVDFFNNELVSSDNMLKLNLSFCTRMMLENGQFFTGNPANRNLIAIYGPSTRSIPAQTTPFKIIVMCRS